MWKSDSDIGLVHSDHDFKAECLSSSSSSCFMFVWFD
ncbi:hypothetical protein NC652_013581 [Populus alba x Populus x berolinensis]|nr:hypothetical protein NC652_013577 [Populus alba x Populus x berolinensis]KAJ6929744.1 hypothetical protein NC652_013581 [Populus alba x Populus x berolinensis]